MSDKTQSLATSIDSVSSSHTAGSKRGTYVADCAAHACPYATQPSVIYNMCAVALLLIKRTAIRGHEEADISIFGYHAYNRPCLAPNYPLMS